MTNEAIGAELVRLKAIADRTDDGQPDGSSETMGALFDFFLEHFEQITSLLANPGI